MSKGRRKEKQTLEASRLRYLLDRTYSMVVDGLPGTRNIYDLTDYYLSRYGPDKAITMITRRQALKSAAAGFVTGLGGVFSLPVAVPADVVSSLYVNMRLAAVIALIRGYDLHDERVRAFIYVTLTNRSAADLMKSFGVQTAKRAAMEYLQDYAVRETLRRVNKYVTRRMLRKGGERSLLHMNKMIPVAGGVISGLFDAFATRSIAKAARRTFKERPPYK